MQGNCTGRCTRQGSHGERGGRGKTAQTALFRHYTAGRDLSLCVYLIIKGTPLLQLTYKAGRCLYIDVYTSFMCLFYTLQFRYSTRVDYVLMFFGTITGIGHGISLPLLMLVFGELINSFIYQEQTATVADCLQVDRVCNVPYTTSDPVILACADNTNTSFLVGFTLDQLVEETYGDRAQCVSDDEFTDQVVLYCIYFTIIATSVFGLGFVQISFFQMACERQVRKIRLLFYRAILKQNIGWFDNNPSGELASRLNE